MTKTAKLYGGSLYDLAADEKLTESVMEEMAEVRKLFKENPDYLRLLSEPSIPKAERIALLDKAFGGQVQPYLLNFLKLLCENGMLREFSDCCREFKARYNKDHNIAEAVVTSAVALTEEQAAALKARLEAMSKKTVMLVQKVDSQVLGGIRVELEGKQLDGTAQGRLNALRRKVTEIIV
ncbi:MAG: ATP synthase F1 subunit delta [Enterocloster sp.]